MKRKFMAMFLICFVVLCSACGNSAEGLTRRQIERIDKEETYPSSTASLVRVFESLEEMYEESLLVVEVSVQDTEVILLDGFPQTISTVQVIGVLKGEVFGDTITIREEGGTVNGTEMCLGVPPLHKSQHLVLFLVDSGMEINDEYCVLGAFQGKFIEREGYYFQQATEDVKLSEKQYYPGKFEDLKELVSPAK